MAIAPEKLQQRLDKLSDEGLRRYTRTLPFTGGVINKDGARTLNLSSNDYLNLASDPRLSSSGQKALEKYGSGATASRLMSGNLPPHEELEKALAKMCATEAAVIFGSGFLANLGVLCALCRRHDVIFSDKLNHASLIDGAQLSGAKVQRYRHSDMEHLEQLLQEKMPENGLALIVSDTVFSMDGDIAPVAKLCELAEKYNAGLVLDEAHAIGVIGEDGGGVLRSLGLAGKADLVMGTMSKSLGCYGGFTACSSLMKEYLINRARTFIYSTGLPPAVVASARTAIDIIHYNPAMGQKLLQKCETFKKLLGENGVEVMPTGSQIIPIFIGENERALAVAEALREKHIIVTAIRPPTVPVGTSRLRMSVTLAHDEADLEYVAREIGLAMKAIC